MYMAGMPDSKILRVVGLASSVSLDEKDPYAAVNRRIAIVVMNKRAEEAVRALANLDEGQNPNLIELPPVPELKGLPFPKNGSGAN
ncbi:MAG: motility protein MotB, partial [Limnobacter sp.]